MRTLFSLLFSFVVLTSWSQEQTGSEIGIDGYFGFSNFGGNVTVGGKYGLNYGEHLIVGPSLRYQRVWNNNQVTGVQGGYNIFGGGAFVHGRFYDALFVGAEFEMMRSPFTSFGAISTTQTKWVPTLFLGGGFSKEFNESWRLNAGIMYDIINAPTSPFRQSYFMRNANNVPIPVIYRVAFFFPIS